MEWLKKTILPRTAAPSAASPAIERASTTSAVTSPPTALPRAVSAKRCPTMPGAGRISPLSSPRTQCGTLTGSRRAASPSCWNCFSAHCTAASAPGEPDSRGPMVSERSRRRAYATPSDRAPPTSWRATSGGTAAETSSIGSNKVGASFEGVALYAIRVRGACARARTLSRGLARDLRGLSIRKGDNDETHSPRCSIRRGLRRRWFQHRARSQPRRLRLRHPPGDGRRDGDELVYRADHLPHPRRQRRPGREGQRRDGDRAERRARGGPRAAG